MKIFTSVKGCLGALAISAALSASAGNIPQYSFNETRSDAFVFLTDATKVTNTFNTEQEMVFPDKQSVTAYTGTGFPIGFDFRYGGRVFNQFAINNNGYLLLGYDKVEFRGYCNLFFSIDNTDRRYATNDFYLGFGPKMFGIAEGEISYKLQGDEGNRTLTVEFAHMNVNEPTRPSRGNAIYSLQIVLCEKDNTVKMNFIEEESPYTSLALACGLSGWSPDDSLVLTSESLRSEAKVSNRVGTSILMPGTLLHWSAEDVLGDGHDDPYSFTYAFTPTGNPEFVCEKPADLAVDQKGSTAVVSCKRPADAPATAILFSEQPILKFPEQGTTYPIYNDDNELITVIDGATLIYYSNDENPVAEFPNLKTSTRYYVKAFGVNGYPSYSTETSADLEFFSSHPAPYVIQASTVSEGIAIKTIGDDDVIIAATPNRVNTLNEGATGIFGTPEANCAVNDEIEGGGKVIYIGEPGEFVYEQADPNRQMFFRAWGLRDGRVSKTSINASGVTNPTMPYEPQLELYSLQEPPLNWVAQTNSSDATILTTFVPRTRGNDDEAVIGGISASGTEASLTSPLIPYGSEATLSFEWSLETVREFSGSASDMVQLPEGNEPGKFGAGHSFTVTAQSRGKETEVFKATEYNGKMTPSPNDETHFISGTSTLLPVSVALPADQPEGKIHFRFTTEGLSILYLRNIMITSESGVVNIIAPEQSDVIYGGQGQLNILSAAGGTYKIYTLEGVLAASVNVEAAEAAVIPLAKGIYVVNNSKVIVK